MISGIKSKSSWYYYCQILEHISRFPNVCVNLIRVFQQKMLVFHSAMMLKLLLCFAPTLTVLKIPQTY